MQIITTYVSQHLNYILGALGVFGVGLIYSAPEDIPSSLQELYAWIREAAQGCLPVSRHSNTPKQ